MFTIIVLMAGYRRTGKDTIYTHIHSGKVYTWTVYHRPGAQMDYPHIFLKMPKVEMSKAVIAEYETMTGNIITDENKEVYRNDLIQLAENRKLTDPSYWIRKALESVEYTNEKYRMCYISGFRFPIEYEYSKSVAKLVITGRVYRKEVPIPDNPEEHALDNFATDFLFIGKNTTLEEACERFPQYRNYVKVSF